MEIDEILDCLVSIISDEVQKVVEEELRKRRRTVWVKPWISRRLQYGASDSLLKELALQDPSTYRNILRMSCDKFEELLKLVEPLIKKENTVMRMAISPRTKLEITLRFLATGDSYQSLRLLFRMPANTISLFIPEVLRAIYVVLKKYIETPKTVEEWREIQDVFYQRWNFPNCCGSIDGKHVQVKCPKKSGSTFFNYKKTFSIILFALVDGNYCFKYIDVGGNGKASDSAVFRDSSLNRALLNNSLNIPNEAVIIGDDAFPLRLDLLKPYNRRKLSIQEAVFNYRLSRARRVVENAFGILAARFRIFLRPIEVKPGTVDWIIKATCALHNWLRITASTTYFISGTVDVEDVDSGTIIPGSWRAEVPTHCLRNISAVGSNNHRKTAGQLRDKYAKYFMNEGAVPWQLKSIGISSIDNCITVSDGENSEDIDGDLEEIV